ncbi:MAG: hypothetical protein NT013_10015 [Planctomycetia bacterium]|nr:hypothetical protein [Planctomycetia bacterium]
MLSAGVIIEGGCVRHSILSCNVVVHELAVVEHSILFDGVSVGAGSRLRNCIVDKGVKIPAGVRIGFNRDQDTARFTVSESGVVVVPKGYVFKSEATA